MFYKTKKLLLGFLAFISFLLIAGCQPQKEPVDLTKNPQGTWQWTEQQLTIQKMFLTTDINTIALALMLDDFDDVKMTMTIKDKAVELKYQFNYLKIYEDQYKGIGYKTPDFQTYIKNKTEDLKNYVATLQHTKITVDEENHAYDYTLTGEIDTENKTITFPETPTFLSKIILGPNSNPLESVTYQYSVDGKQISLSAEQRDNNNLLHVMRLRFNYLEETK